MTAMDQQAPDVEIWHNPACSKSRETLALILRAGLEPRVTEYLRNPPDKARLRDAIAAAGLSVRDAIRDTEPDYQARGLDDLALDDDALLDAMLAAPILINRPFVFAPLGVRLCRPPQAVLDILPPCARLAVEDGGAVTEVDGSRAH